MRRVLGLLGTGGGAPKEWTIEDRRVVEERPISEGGFAFVVQARDVQTGEVFALKKMICQDAESLNTAQREVSVLEGLPSHKNIVGYHGHAVVERGQQGSTHRVVLMLLELCTGGTLLDLFYRHDRLVPEDELVRAITDIAEAVFCLHSHSPAIAHRDLKLENVLRGEDGFWKVVDFGSWSDRQLDLADLPTKELTLLAEEVGRHTTMMYRPPELVDVYLRYPITCTVDIWTIGCILVTLLYGRHPFQEASALAIREARYTLPVRTPEPNQKLKDLALWLLAPDPRHRPTARRLVTLLWQWGDLEALELPAPVLEHRARLEAMADEHRPAARPKAAAAAVGARAAEEAAEVAEAAVEAADAAAGAWTASFADFGQVAEVPEAAAPEVAAPEAAAPEAAAPEAAVPEAAAPEAAAREAAAREAAAREAAAREAAAREAAAPP